ncbi:MAG: carbohydrate kinase [Bacteroidetes bacterium]|nr:carbohydrate kinase [Bacteroidota bacterium]
MKSTSVIAIFDVGKTNKKLFLFDEQYRIVHEEITQFPEVKDEDGDPCEDVEQLSQWIRNSLNKLLADKDFNVKAINFSAYGASFVHLDKNGKVISPLYNYLKPYSEDLKKKFYDTYGGELDFCKTTASPALGSLNSGMVLFRLKYEKSDLFKSIRYSLHLPQYLSFLITGKMYSDITSIGCHTNLWDFTQHKYHSWLVKEGVDEKLAPIFPSDKVMEVSLSEEFFSVGAGLHDSSSALIPYLKKFQDPFILISTGTWCISLNPFNQNPLTAEELKKDCLCYLSYEGKPVKASRLFAGNEHETQIKRLAAHFNTDLDYYKTVQYDSQIIATLKKKKLDLPECSSYEVAYHQLMLDIITLQKKSTDLVLTDTSVKQIFVDGGFSKNIIYMNLLSQEYSSIKVFAASAAQATALGAAMAIHNHWNSGSLPENVIELKEYGSQQT